MEHFTQYVCSQTTARDSSVSLILTRKCIISVGFYIVNHNSNTKLIFFYLCILLNVTAHDTEVNLGPCRPKLPCQLCYNAVKWVSHVITALDGIILIT